MTTLERIRAEIEQIIPSELPYGKNTPENIRDMTLEIIDKYAEQEPRVKNELNVELNELKPCEDAISRQAVINLVRGCNSALEEPRIFNCHNAGVKFEQYVTELPSVQPKAKTGRWIEDKTTYAGTGMGNYKCSVCDRINGTWIKDMPSVYPNFCWWCGAEMKGGAE